MVGGRQRRRGRSSWEETGQMLDVARDGHRTSLGVRSGQRLREPVDQRDTQTEVSGRETVGRCDWRITGQWTGVSRWLREQSRNCHCEERWRKGARRSERGRAGAMYPESIGDTLMGQTFHNEDGLECTWYLPTSTCSPRNPTLTQVPSHHRCLSMTLPELEATPGSRVLRLQGGEDRTLEGASGQAFPVPRASRKELSCPRSSLWLWSLQT